ncbi:hypothetical protein F2Q70_00020030 [Brassica cretica]|uniref:CBS domain-containing protein n=1 Tax=Brassica cretica TaxID=69181 RepID=A0A8S9GR55_BRACR|nr:hypothetical protein F2Q70_00020030 [Brassica cretica]
MMFRQALVVGGACCPLIASIGRDLPSVSFAIFGVAMSGTLTPSLLGYVSKLEWSSMKDEQKEMKIYDYMRSCESRDYYVPCDIDLDKIDAVLEDKQKGFVVLEKDGETVNVVTKDDVERVKGYPKLGPGTVWSRQ